MFTSFNKCKSLKQVLNGKFPEAEVKKMNSRNLENFVLKLVECCSDTGGKSAKSFTGLYRSLCLKQIEKPEWWPSEKVIEQSLTSDNKCFVELLQFLIYKCCEFFKKPYEGCNKKVFVHDNDENCNGVKRKYCETDVIEVPNKRRTLMPKNIKSSKCKSFMDVPDALIKSPVVLLKDIYNKVKPEPLKQHTFLKSLGLQSTMFISSAKDLRMSVVSARPIKFNSCSVIPFSSDLGRKLLKKDNHTFSESLKGRRLERLEWYVNQPPPNYIDIIYEVTYQEQKDVKFHNFKFPKRSIWQHPGDVEHQKKKIFCKPLKVILIRNNLEAIKQKINLNSQPKLSVVLSRMPIKSYIGKRYGRRHGLG